MEIKGYSAFFFFFFLSNKVIKFIAEALKNWIVELPVRGKTLTEVKIQ